VGKPAPERLNQSGC